MPEHFSSQIGFPLSNSDTHKMMDSLADMRQSLPPGAYPEGRGKEEPWPPIGEVEATNTAKDDVSEKCRLFTLPAELRNRIYEDVVIEDEAIPIMWKGEELLAQPPLTRVNRQLRNEALPMFYGQNTFEMNAEIPEVVWDTLAMYNRRPAERGGTNWRRQAFLIFDRYFKQFPTLLKVLDIARRWLTAIGKRNQEFVGELVYVIGPNFSGSWWAIDMIASARFDEVRKEIIETDAPLLVEGWEWGSRPFRDHSDDPGKYRKRISRRMAFKAD